MIGKSYTQLDRYRLERLLFRRYGYALLAVHRVLNRKGAARKIVDEVLADIRKEGFMMFTETGRAYRNNDPDNYVDAIGYMGMAGEAATGKDSDIIEYP